MAACKHECSLLVFNLISHSLAALTHEISSLTPEEKFHIYAHPYIILYIIKRRSLYPEHHYPIQVRSLELKSMDTKKAK